MIDDGKRKREYVEVKNVNLIRKKGIEELKDKVKERGEKNMEEIVDVVEDGNRGIMMFIIKRED